MQAKKKDVELDPRIFPVREQGPKTGPVHLSKYHSKTCMDENSGRAPSDAHPTSQQKRHSTKSALKMVDRTGLEPVTSCV